MKRLAWRSLRIARLVAVWLAILPLILPVAIWAEVITLKNGMSAQGSVGTVGSMQLDVTKQGNTSVKQIVVVNDDLRRIFFGANQQATLPTTPPATSFERIKIPQRAATTAHELVSVGPIVRTTAFDDKGRRIITMVAPDGNISIVQGITEITPTYSKVEALQVQSGINSFVWSTRIATSSIPRDTLSRILKTFIDQKNADARLRVVRLYIQSDRINDARVELDGIIKDFPELAHLKDQVKTLRQLAAQRIIKEIQVRRDAGQHALARNMLDNFPSEGVAGETLLKVRDAIKEFDDQKARGEQVVKLMEQHYAALADDKAREEVKPILAEISAELSLNTLDRMADYLRLADDPGQTAEQKLSLAISGWLLGSGSGTDNLAVSKSLFQVRNLVRTYLNSRLQAERDAILIKLKELEGGTPPYIAKLIANMKPAYEPGEGIAAAVPAPALDLEAKDDDLVGKVAPKEKAPEKPGVKKGGPKPAAEKVVPPAKEVPPAEAVAEPAKDCDDPVKKEGKDEEKKAPPKDLLGEKEEPKEPGEQSGEQPAAQAGEENGFYELQAKGPSEHPDIKYYVQLPPEYDPYRRYPVIVTLNGAGTTPKQQVDWWAGAFNTTGNTRYGQASRYGYIVVAPVWTREHQRKYEFSAGEHSAVLNPLRDVCRRFAVDTDKIFLSGHSMGGDAAWDIGLSHPDLWAGVIPIVATADKHVSRYWQNASLLPLYFISGERDGNKLAMNGVEWDRYLRKSEASLWDVMVIQYQGRGHESYHDDIQNTFDWMNLHRRNFFPKDFKAQSLRPWDNFFWYAEFDGMLPNNILLPVEWTGDKPPKRSTLDITGGIVTDSNVVRITCGATKVTVWLSPEMVDFSKKIIVNINGKPVKGPFEPKLVDLLEDVRLRGDRQHPFWLKVAAR